MTDTRKIEIDKIQSIQYSFPYHYLPNSEGFPNFAKTWSWSPSYIAAIRLFFKWFNDEKKSDGVHRHMDYGCGDGGFLYHILALDTYENIEFWGIDFDEKALGWANQFFGGGNFICGNIADLPSSNYDSGSLVEVYEHIPPSECPRFLSSISDSLKSGAPLFVTVPSVQKPTSAKHYRHFDFETLIEEFGEFFVVEEIFGFERKSFISKMLLRLLYTSWWYVETRFTSRLLIKTLETKFASIVGCGRIGLLLRNK